MTKYNDISIIKEFKEIQGNRDKDVKFVRELKTIILQTKIIAPCIININTNNILDGQHRRQAYIELREEGLIDETLELPVMYVDIPEEKEIEIVNKLQKSHDWNTNTYYQVQIKIGNENITKFNDFIMNHPFLHTINKKGVKKAKGRYGQACVFGSNVSRLIKNNTLQCTDKDIELGYKVADATYSIFQILRQPSGAWVEPMIQAWRLIMLDPQKMDVLSTINFNIILDQIRTYMPEALWTNKESWLQYFNNTIYQIQRKVKSMAYAA